MTDDPRITCPTCDLVLDRQHDPATGVDTGAKPGDRVVCTGCYRLLRVVAIVAGKRVVRPATIDETIEAMQRDELPAHLAVVIAITCLGDAFRTGIEQAVSA